MADLEEQIAAVMNNPDMMAQIMALANNMGLSAPEPVAEKAPDLGGIDPGMLQKLTSFATKGQIDNNQQALLKALRPYISGARIQRLERAMKAAKLANIATNLLGR